MHINVIYVSLASTYTYSLFFRRLATLETDMKAVLYMPLRWTLYSLTMPAIWWVLYRVSSYTPQRVLYVLWLNWVMLIAGGLATIPYLAWGHKVYWMVLSCVPFPELCFHLWCAHSQARACAQCSERISWSKCALRRARDSCGRHGACCPLTSHATASLSDFAGR